MKNFFLLILGITVLTSCSDYQKVLKSEDIAEKYKFGSDLYDQGKYSKANRLFAQIVPSYRGKPQAERLMYLYAKSFYEMGDYHLAGYQFERFAESYPKSEKAEEAAFLGAKSYYELSPVYSKEQKETQEAIDKLQLFVNQYPDSEYLEEANKLVNELDYKLQKKAFEIAKQYNTTANFDSSDYEASIAAFEDFLFEYPGSSFREDALYYRFDSAYQLAINSIEYKKKDRLEIAKTYYDALLRYFPDTKYKDALAEMSNNMEAAMARYDIKS